MFMYKKMILPTDGSELSFVGVEEGLEAAKKFDIPVVAIYVIKPSSYSHGMMGQEMEGMNISTQEMLREGFVKQGENVLEKVKMKAEDIDVELKTKLTEGTPYDEITKLANEKDIIYMSSHGRSGLSSLFLGSTTDRVIKHTRCTVAVVRPKDDES